MKATLTVLSTLAVLFFYLNSVYAIEPTREAVELIENGYVPGITVHVESSEEKGVNGLATCQIQKIRIEAKDPIEDQLSHIGARLYQPRIFGQMNPNSKAVIVLPPLGGTTPLEDAYSLGFCAFGFRAVALEYWTPNSRNEFDLKAHDRQAVRAVTAVRRLIELIAPTRKNQVGVLGTSAGAIMGALALGVDSRLGAGVLIAGGGDLPEIFTTSTEPGIQRLRQKRMKRYGFKSLEEYYLALKQNIRIDPVQFARFSGPKRVLTILAENDTVVPTSTQWALYEAFGKQELIRINSSHELTIARAAVIHHRDILTFLDANLE